MAQLNTWGPPPTHLTSLPSLPSLAPGTKVRFFGLVQHYHAPSATLLLAADAGPYDASALRAAVDIAVPLADASHTMLATGARVIVVGYILARASEAAKPLHETRAEWELRKAGVRVQALLLSDAGRTAGDAWSEAARARQAAAEAMRAARERAARDGGTD